MDFFFNLNAQSTNKVINYPNN